MRVTLEGTERDIMEEESYITHSQLQEVVRDALAQQAVVYAESIRKQNETLTTLQAEVQTLQSAQTTPVAPPVQQNSMMLLSSLTDLAAAARARARAQSGDEEGSTAAMEEEAEVDT